MFNTLRQQLDYLLTLAVPVCLQEPLEARDTLSAPYLGSAIIFQHLPADGQRAINARVSIIALILISGARCPYASSTRRTQSSKRCRQKPRQVVGGHRVDEVGLIATTVQPPGTH